ncbi:thiamine pyrophosphate-binding protein [Pseudooceanicola aestuarii]|uniref:thiamine pyrophosphate-binding protein n=1 Tax=Pseudooceanicola aestuarii TaxID=2697319 RepID=UPI0013D628E3|nr:thiamine pyrophosphate-binding protein [Pseudooceanicola aestuarii]
MNLHEVIADGLAQLGVSHLYGLIGDANLFMVNSYVATGTGRYIACNHEANAVLAAIGHAQVTGRTGVATITHGPALTNAATALAEAAKGGIPLVVLCGDTAPGDLQHIQNIDQREVVRATGAEFIDLRGPDTALTDLERAFRLAGHNRRPVVLNMRVDQQWAETEPQTIAFGLPEVTLAPASGPLLEEAVGMLASAKRPLILAGRACIDPDAREALIALADRIEAPLATTLKAQALFEGHPHNIGISGNLSHPTATEVIMQSDCILAFGASLSKYTTENGTYTKGKRVVQVLPDALETPRMDPPSIRLIGDIAGTAQAMTALLDLAEIPGSAAADTALAERLAAEATAQRVLPPAQPTAPGTVDIVPALRRLHQALPRRRVLVADLGRFVFSAWRNLPVTDPRDLVFTAHFGGIGCGMGQAIGAATAVDDRPTVLVAGDGGFLLSAMGELSALRREGADMVIILCNDGSYGAEHVQFTNRRIAPDLSMIAPPDFAAVARANGLEAVAVTDASSLDAACAAIGARRGPLLIDLRLDPEKVFK